MERKFLIATHSVLAEGFTKALQFFAGESVNISFINAYVNDKPIIEEISELVKNLDKETELIVLTDLLAGSVNQTFFQYVAREHTHIITGANLALGLSLVLEPSETYLSGDRIREIVSTAKENIVYMNEYEVEVDDDDE